jgi:hypothetical protein
VEQEEANDILRKAVQVDPDFAMGHEFLAQISLDSAEQVSEQEKAFATRNRATNSEQLVAFPAGPVRAGKRHLRTIRDRGFSRPD